MKYEQYVSLIKGLEMSAAKNRSLYELKVVGLSLLGYGYFIGLILLFVSIPFVVLIAVLFFPVVIGKILLWTVKLWWAVVPALAVYFGFLGSAVKALFTKVPEPEGTAIEPADAPALSQFIDSTCRELKASRPRRVFITDEFNASVMTMPRFGMFGTKVYIRLGLPVMKALSPDQFKAVLAHEIGHISGKHGGFGKWAYQLHESWGRFIEAQEIVGGKFAGLYEKFVNWFFPYFQAYSFVLMREHEKEADDYAVEVVAAKPLGEALIALQTRASSLEEQFWPVIHQENQKSSVPAGDVFSRMLGSLAFTDNAHDTTSLEKALKVPTDYADSHPALADRLKRIGFWDGDGLPVLPGVPSVSAADHFLGKTQERYAQEFENKWSEEIARTWGERYKHFEAARQRVDEIDSKAAEELTVAELLEKAGLIAEQQGNREAMPLLHQAVTREPENAEALYFLGAVTLQQDDESGLELLRRAMSLDEKLKYSAADAAFQFLRQKGRLDEAKEFAAILDAQAEDFNSAQRERSAISASDQFLPHAYDEKAVAEIVQKVRYYDEIVAVYLANKDVKFLKDFPFPVLFIEMRKPSKFKLNKDMSANDLLAAVVDRLAPFDLGYFAILDGEFKPLKAKLEQIPNARIFLREASS